MFAYTIHAQPRLASLAIAIAAVDPGISQLAIESHHDGLAVAFTHTDAHAVRQAVIPVPGSLVPQHRQTIPLHPPRPTYELKLPCRHSTTNDDGNSLDIINPPLGAPVLNGQNVFAARCKACIGVIWHVGHNLEQGRMASPRPAKNESTTTLPPCKRLRECTPSTPNAPPPPPPPPRPPTYIFRPLPSSHWHESSEAWLCHPSGEFTAKIAKQLQTGWWPTPLVGLVAERWVAVAAGVVDWPNGMTDLPEPSLTSWTPLYCQCGASLGVKNIRWVDDMPEEAHLNGISLIDEYGRREAALTYRLDKYAVEFLGGGRSSEDALATTAANTTVLTCSIDECLATEMLEHAQSLGIRKFVVVDEQTQEEQLFLWLFNPDTEIAWGSIHVDKRSGVLETHSRAGKFVTVLWQDITQSKPIPPSERHETLGYPSSAISQIRAVLTGDEECVPRDDKVVMGQWRVGYLRRR